MHSSLHGKMTAMWKGVIGEAPNDTRLFLCGSRPADSYIGNLSEGLRSQIDFNLVNKHLVPAQNFKFLGLVWNTVSGKVSIVDQKRLAGEYH